MRATKARVPRCLYSYAARPPASLLRQDGPPHPSRQGRSMVFNPAASPAAAPGIDSLDHVMGRSVVMVQCSCLKIIEKLQSVASI